MILVDLGYYRGHPLAILNSKVVSTHRTGTHPGCNLYQQAISAGIPFIIGVAGGLPLTGVRYRGVLQFSWRHHFLGTFYRDLQMAIDRRDRKIHR